MLWSPTKDQPLKNMYWFTNAQLFSKVKQNCWMIGSKMKGKEVNSASPYLLWFPWWTRCLNPGQRLQNRERDWLIWNLKMALCGGSYCLRKCCGSHDRPVKLSPIHSAQNPPWKQKQKQKCKTHLSIKAGLFSCQEPAFFRSPEPMNNNNFTSNFFS